MKIGTNVLMPHVEKRVQVNSNIRGISLDIWKGMKGMNINVQLADLCGHQEKIGMSMKGLFTGR